MGVAHGGSGIPVPQHLLRLIQRMPGIHEKRGESVPQVVDAHIGKPQFPPELVPEVIEVTERLSRRMAGEQPRITGAAGQGAKNFYGLFGQENMARPAGFGQRHGEQPLIRTDVFPAGLEDFVLAAAGQQKQTDGKGFRPVAFLQRPHEPLRFVLREIALPLRVDFEGRDARAR